MATPEYINVGPSPNDGLGDPIRTAFQKSNDWFGFLNSRVQTSPPSSLVGTPGDQAGMYAFDSNYFYYCFADYDGSSVIWAQISQVGNISVPQISNGTTSVGIGAVNGNVAFTVGGTSNVIVVSTSGASVNGNVTATNFIGSGVSLTGVVLSSNLNTLIAGYLPTYTGALYPGSIFTNNYYYANGVPFSGGNGGGGGTYGDSNVAAYLPTYTGNLGGTLLNGVQTNITQVGTLSELMVSGIHDIDLQSIASNISITTTFGGTITINPSGLGSIDNTTIGANIPQSGKFTSVSATGNVTGTYFIGDGSLLTNIGGGGNYGNADVAAYLPTYTGNILGGNISVTGNVTVNGTTNANVVGQLTGPVNGINMSYLIWDFGNIDGVTFNTPIAYIFATTAAGNLDMGTVNSPSSYNIDIGTIY